MDEKATADNAQEATSHENENIQNEEANDNVMSDPSENTDALTELQEKYDTVNDKFLRLYSEFENFRRRTAKEKLEAMKTDGADLVKELLPVLDDFDRAVASNENIEDPETLKEGFVLIHSKLLRILQNKGLKSMDSLEQPFDTEYHDAITNIPAPTKDLKGKVVDVAEKGYFYNDTILRHAKVIVGQ